MEVLSSQSSESLVLGGIINNLSWIVELSNLKVDYFTVEVNKIIYSALKRLYKNGLVNCDIADIYATIETNKTYLRAIEEVGGIDYLETLFDLGYGKELDDIKAHAKTIIDCSYKNNLVNTLNGLTEYVKMHRDKPKEYVAKIVEGELLDLKSKYHTNVGMTKVGDNMDSILKKLDGEGQKEFSGFPTFSPLLNKFVTYERGECVIYSGKMKTGKSQLVVNEVYRLCILGGVPCAVLDTELSTRFFVTRLIARITGYNMKFIKSGLYKDNPKTLKKFNEAVEMIRNAPLVHQYVFEMNQDELTEELKRLKIQMNLQVVFFDYIKASVSSTDDMQERLQMANMTNWLKNTCAGQLDLAVVALAQTNPNPNGGLRIFGSNQVSMYGSTVIYLVRKTKEQYERDYNEIGGNYYLYISENRNGQQFDDEQYGINIVFNTSNCTISQANYQCEDILRMAQEDDSNIEQSNTI